MVIGWDRYKWLKQVIDLSRNRRLPFRLDEEAGLRLLFLAVKYRLSIGRERRSSRAKRRIETKAVCNPSVVRNTRSSMKKQRGGKRSTQPQLPRFGQLEPQYNLALNPYPDARLSKCPNCEQKTRQRKLPLLIHVARCT